MSEGKNMKAFFINPFSKKITTVDYDGDYQSISRMIDSSRGYFDVVRLYENQDAAFVDDEGLYVEDQTFWIHRPALKSWSRTFGLLVIDLSCSYCTLLSVRSMITAHTFSKTWRLHNGTRYVFAR